MTTRRDVRRGDPLVGAGGVRGVFLDTATERTRPIPETVRPGLEPGPGAPGRGSASVRQHAATAP